MAYKFPSYTAVPGVIVGEEGGMPQPAQPGQPAKPAAPQPQESQHPRQKVCRAAAKRTKKPFAFT